MVCGTEGVSSPLLLKMEDVARLKSALLADKRLAIARLPVLRERCRGLRDRFLTFGESGAAAAAYPVVSWLPFLVGDARDSICCAADTDEISTLDRRLVGLLTRGVR